MPFSTPFLKFSCTLKLLELGNFKLIYTVTFLFKFISDFSTVRRLYQLTSPVNIAGHFKDISPRMCNRVMNLMYIILFPLIVGLYFEKIESVIGV